MTSRRRLLLGCGLLLLVASLLASWPELLGIAAGLFVLPFILRTPRNTPDVQWSDVSVPIRVVRGEPAEAVTAITSTESLPTALLSATDGQGRRLWVDPASQLLRWPIDSARRGRTLAGPIELQFIDPLGLNQHIIAKRRPDSVVVVPRIHSVEAHRVTLGRSGTGWQRQRSVVAPDSGTRGIEEFHSLREYTLGDSLRLIHWRKTAQLGYPVIRSMTDSDTTTYLIVLDVARESYAARSSLFAEFSDADFEAAVDLAASWAWWAAQETGKVTCTTTLVGARESTVDVRGREKLLDYLAEVEVVEDGCSLTRLQEVASRCGASSVIYVTGSSGAHPAAGAGGRSAYVSVVTSA